MLAIIWGHGVVPGSASTAGREGGNIEYFLFFYMLGGLGSFLLALNHPNNKNLGFIVSFIAFMIIILIWPALIFARLLNR